MNNLAITPYRDNAKLATAKHDVRWTSPLKRVYVKLCRRLFWWTLAARRYHWRRRCRYIEFLTRHLHKIGLEHVIIRAKDGSIIKNKYIYHDEPPWRDLVEVEKYRLNRNRHSPMPRI